MQTRQNEDTAAAVWMDAMKMFARAQPSGFSRDGAHGTSQVISGAAMPLLNGVFSSAREPDAAEIAAFAGSPELRSMPWSVQVRGERFDPRIADTAAAHGLARRSTLPFMLKSLSQADAADAEDGASKVRPVGGDESALYQAMLAAGYEGPPSLFTPMCLPSVLDHPAMRAYVAEEAGEPVATSFGVFLGDHVAVFNIAVLPAHRRRGHGRAATAAVLRDGYAIGARTAFLHSSTMGVPLYESMGFHIAENWTTFIS
ncbi:GNAT family N-acetyltransferase [Sphaerisporangium sp. NPDC004334]